MIFSYLLTYSLCANEDVDYAASEFSDSQQRDEDPARSNHTLDEERQHHGRADTCRQRGRSTLDVRQIHSSQTLRLLPPCRLVSRRHRDGAICCSLINNTQYSVSLVSLLTRLYFPRTGSQCSPNGREKRGIGNAVATYNLAHLTRITTAGFAVEVAS